MLWTRLRSRTRVDRLVYGARDSHLSGSVAERNPWHKITPGNYLIYNDLRRISHHLAIAVAL